MISDLQLSVPAINVFGTRSQNDNRFFADCTYALIIEIDVRTIDLEISMARPFARVWHVAAGPVNTGRFARRTDGSGPQQQMNTCSEQGADIN